MNGEKESNSDRLRAAVTSRHVVTGRLHRRRRSRQTAILIVAGVIGVIALLAITWNHRAAGSTAIDQHDAAEDVAASPAIATTGRVLAAKTGTHLSLIDDPVLAASLTTLSSELSKLSSALATYRAGGLPDNNSGSGSGPVTTIREIVHSGTGGTGGIDASALVSRTLFDAQVDAIYDSLTNGLGGLGDTFASGALTVSGNASIGQALTANTLTVSSGVTLSQFTAGSIPFVGANGLLSEDNDGLFFDATNGRFGIGTSSPATILHARGENPVLTLGDTRTKTWTDGEQLAALDFASDDGSSGGYAGKVKARIATVEEIACCGTAFGASVGLAFSTSRITDGGVLREYMRLNHAGDLILSRSTHTPFGVINNGPTYLTIMGSGGGGTGNIQLSNSNSGSSAGTSLGNIEWHNIAVGTGTANSRSAYINVSLSGTTGETIGSYMAFATEADGVTGAASERMRIDASGNLGIGTTTPTAQLHTTGSVRFSTFGAGSLQTDAAGNLSVSSDEILKDDIAPFARSLDDLLSIQPISFRWRKGTGMDTENTYTGFSAQNVRGAIPEAVGSGPNGKLTLSDRPILAVVVNAVKALYRQITELAETVAGFAISFSSQEITAERLCVDDICVTRDAFQAMVEAAGADPASPAPASTTDEVEAVPDVDEGTEPPSSEADPAIEDTAGDVDLDDQPAETEDPVATSTSIAAQAEPIAEESALTPSARDEADDAGVPVKLEAEAGL